MTCLPHGQPLLVAVVAYALFVALAVIAPALAVLRLLRLPIDPAAVIPLGLGVCAAAYALSLAIGRPWLFPALLVALVGAAGITTRGLSWRCAPGPSLRGALPPMMALLALYAVTQYPLNRCTPDGGFALDSLERVDTAFHVAVTWELTQAWPPQVPGLAGVPLDYHIGPHLVRAAAQRWAGIHPYDALARLDLTLWTLALVLAWRSLAGTLQAPPIVIALMPWTLLLTDFSWLLAGRAREAWLTELLGGNLLVALFFTNALLPALAMMLVALGALARAERGEGSRWLGLAALLGACVPFFKVFLGAQLLGGLTLAFLLGRRRREVICAAAPCLLAVAWLASGAGAGSLRVHLQPLAIVQQALAAFGFDAAAGAGLALAALAWLILSLGLRALGLREAWRALRGPSAAGVALAAMALCGFVLRLLVRVSADGRFDEGVYFSVQSGALLWFYAVTALVLAWRLGAGRARVAVVAVCALALPTTAEFVWRKAWMRADPVPASVLRATSRLAELTAPGEVVLTPSFSRYPPPAVVFIGRRSAYAEYLPYLEQFAPAVLLAERERALRRLFRDVDEPAARRTAAALNARYVACYGRETAVERSDWLERVYTENGARLYKLREAGTKPDIVERGDAVVASPRAPPPFTPE